MTDLRFGLLGKTLKHSFSKDFFEKYFSQEKINASYENIEVDSSENLRLFFQNDIFRFRGVNVTIPYKESVLPFLDELTPEAMEIGAVNTIKVVDTKLIGHNTDQFGFHQAIKPFLTNQHEKALVFGTGGASKAVAYVLKNLGIDVLYISRSQKGNMIFSYDDINQYMLNACKLLVNTTPVGMFPQVDEILPLPYEFLSPQHLAVDLIYNPQETLFLKQAKTQGAMTLNGMTMLREQALEAWRFWNNGKH